MNRNAQAGQTMIFTIMALVIICFIILWNFDLHAILHLKTRTQNAGDAAALAAARWQGITLNLIGDLNIMQAVALTSGDAAMSAQITNLQARLCFVGPMIALLAAQQAAKNNGVYVNDAFTTQTLTHAQAVQNDYPEVFREPYTGCWNDYSYMLKAVAGQGMAAGPDNARYYTDYTGGHDLLILGFYDAVAGRDWCWFERFHYVNLLEDYTDYTWWPALPARESEGLKANSEIFGVGVCPVETRLPGGSNNVPLLNQLRAERHLSEIEITNSVADISTVWYIYDETIWAAWSQLAPSNAFPILGYLKPQYDYSGADAAVRIEALTTRMTPGSASSLITWTAAAKPFGCLTNGTTMEAPNTYSLVLPAFRQARLIPADACSGPEGGAYNLAWRAHINDHLPLYMLNGLNGLEASCWYCQQLVTWEDSAFRAEGLEWLTITDDYGHRIHPCFSPPPGGPGTHGGTRRGH